MKQLAVGILAHVDAGKTTLSEGLLYLCGVIQKLGRVDHQTAFLDTFALERERGITIFSKQASLRYEDMSITLLDTPGHMDFSAEMERSLQVLDYAILVISGTDGVQSHTQTLWRLLARYEIPTFLFINKMDLDGADVTSVLQELQNRLDSNCISFTQAEDEELWEQIALCDEEVMTRYLDSGVISDEEIGALIAARKLFPCHFGSARQLTGVEDFLVKLRRFTLTPHYPAAFGARVFKITRDKQGARLTHLKLTGGSLSVKDIVRIPDKDGAREEKVDQIRLYSGEKYESVKEAVAGMICAVTGLDGTYAGQSLGHEAPAPAPALAPVMTHRLLLPEGIDPVEALKALRLLEEEDPQLHILWQEQKREIHMQLMGEIQLEILKRLIEDRFQMAVTFEEGSVIYKETIAAPVEGVGHFEPLRHYAEVHLLLEPLPPGSGLHFAADCSEATLGAVWQKLVLTHLEEKVHLGVLTGSPITDMKITLRSGRAHQTHTEGGDFREATYRAVRHGLQNAESVLLEPWYRLRLELPPESVGRAMTDIQQMGGTVSSPEPEGAYSVLEGQVPVSAMGSYALTFTSYTKGQGRLSYTPDGYRPCHAQEAVVAALAYDSERDLENTADSVFCAHGAGFTVKWPDVKAHMHLPSILQKRPTEAAPSKRSKPAQPSEALEQEKELMAIYERTYGPVKRRDFVPQEELSRREENKKQPTYTAPAPEFLLVDGYNIIHAWDELKDLAADNLDAARKRLMDILSNYQGYKKCHLILVFDAYKVFGNPGSISRYHNIHVVYTKEAETADAYIEKTTYELGKRYRVRVATSDNTEQLIILGHGALRVSAKAFHAEVQQVTSQIREIIAEQRLKNRSQDVAEAMKAALAEAEKTNILPSE